MAIGAENARSHRARRRNSILIQFIQQQAGLRQRTGSIMGYRMARRCRGREFRNHVQRIGRRYHSHRRVPIDDQPLLAGGRTMAAHTILILVDRRRENRDPIQRADPAHPRLRRTQRRWRGELCRLIGGVRVVAIDACGMTVVVQQHRFSSVVVVIPGGQRMSGLRYLGHDVHRYGRQVRSPVVTGHAILRNRIGSRRRRCGRTQQSCRRNRVMRHVTRCARIDSDRRIRTHVAIRRNLVGCSLVNAPRKTRQRIDPPLQHPVGIVAGQTHLRVRAIADEKILRNPVDRLHVGGVTTGALDVAFDELHRTGRIGRLALRHQRRHQVGRVFHGQHQAERVRTGQRRPKGIDAVQ